MASKGSPGSSSSDHSEKKALLAQPETLDISDDGTTTGSTEARTESTTTSPFYDAASPAEPSSEAESSQSGSSLPKDGSGSSDAAAELPELTNRSAATGRDESPLESEERDTAAAENVTSDQPRELSQDQPRSETRATEIEGLIARGDAGHPAVETTPLRIGPRSPRRYYSTRRLVNPNEHTGVLACLAKFYRCWQVYSIYLTDSIFLLPLQFLLIAVSLITIIMGSVFVYKCPMANVLPPMIIFMGFLGFVLMTLRVVFVVYFCVSLVLEFLRKIRAWIIIVSLFFIATYAIEMWTFFSNTASFDANNHDYCNPAFYTFATILNYGLLIVLLLLFIQHFPAILYNQLNGGPPGYPIEESR